MTPMQRALSLIFPDQCALCRAQVDGQGGLCAECWRSMPFLGGLTCDACGASLPGEGDGVRDYCDDCLATPRPWDAGRAAIRYAGSGRRLVLGLKHGDRTDLVPAVAGWMARAGRDILCDKPLLVPVPIHWTRLVRRRYNQAAELARTVGRLAGCPVSVDALARPRRTPPQEGISASERFARMDGAIAAGPGASALKGRSVCLVDDVMTSGATLSDAAKTAHEAGADRVFVLVLARAEKLP